MQLHKQKPQCGRQTALQANERVKLPVQGGSAYKHLAGTVHSVCVCVCACEAAYLTSWAAQGATLFASRAMIVTIYGRLAADSYLFFVCPSRQVDQKELYR